MRATHLGPYRIERELGAGGMGKVYAAVVEGAVPGGGDDPALAPGERVALKVVHPHLAASPDFLERFRREAALGRALRHPNVVATLDAGDALLDGAPCAYLAMEFVAGQTLRGLADEVGRAPEDLCRHVGREMARALAAVHAAGVVHRDVKPENVVVTPEQVVKLMDLGVARKLDDARLTATGAFVGSLRYAAPEWFRSGFGEPDHRADLHALGLVLYELATGVAPYAADDVAATVRRVLQEVPARAGELAPQLTPFFEEVLQRLLRKDPRERFASAGEVLDVLERGESCTWWGERTSALRAATRRPLRRVRIPRDTALHGRDAELARLGALFGAAKSGAGRVLLVEGEAGIGKSRLVDEFVGRLEAAGEDVEFLHGSYPPGGAASAWGPYVAAVREHLGERDVESALAGPLGDGAASFAAFLRGDAATAGTAAPTRERIQDGFARLLAAFAAERPLVVLVDDLHFAPAEGRALFAALAAAAPPHRLLLVGTTRPGLDPAYAADLLRLPHAERIPVGRLDTSVLRALLREATGSDTAAADLAPRLALKSDGNPYFVFEMLRALRERTLRDGTSRAGTVVGSWVTTGAVAEVTIPDSLRGLVAARIAALAPEDRDLLEAAACQGFEFDAAVLAEVSGLGRIPVLKALARLERGERIVRAAGRRFVFDHHQVHEVLYAETSEMLREEYHAAIGDALEAAHGAADADPARLPGAAALELTHHFLRSSARARAARYLDRAILHLEATCSAEEMVALTERSLAGDLLAGTRRVEVLLRHGMGLAEVGRGAEADAAFAEAVASADAQGAPLLRAKARKIAGYTHLSANRVREAHELLETGAACAREAGDANLEAYLTSLLGVATDFAGRPADALALHERAVALARTLGPAGEGTFASCSGNLGLALADVGREEEALEHLAVYRDHARAYGIRRNESIALGNMGIVLQSLGRLDEALDHHRRWLDLRRELGDRRGQVAALSGIGSQLLQLGRVEEGMQAHADSLAVSEQIGDVGGEIRGHIGVATAHLLLGRPADAIPSFERAAEIDARHRRDESDVHVVAGLGAALAALGRRDAARSKLEDALAAAAKGGQRRMELTVRERLAEVLGDAGDVAGAERLLRDALRAETREHVSALPLLLALGRLLADTGRTDEAHAAFARAAALLPRSQEPGLRVRALAALAAHAGGDAAAAEEALRADADRVGPWDALAARLDLYRATGAAAHGDAARRLAESLVALAPKGDRDGMRANVRAVREGLAPPPPRAGAASESSTRVAAPSEAPPG